MIALEAKEERYVNDEEFEWGREAERVLRDRVMKGYTGSEVSKNRTGRTGLNGCTAIRLIASARSKRNTTPVNVPSHNVTVAPSEQASRSRAFDELRIRCILSIVAGYGRIRRHRRFGWGWPFSVKTSDPTSSANRRGTGGGYDAA